MTSKDDPVKEEQTKQAAPKDSDESTESQAAEGWDEGDARKVAKGKVLVTAKMRFKGNGLNLHVGQTGVISKKDADLLLEEGLIEEYK